MRSQSLITLTILGSAFLALSSAKFELRKSLKKTSYEDDLFQNFISQYNKIYLTDSERNYRKQNFLKNLNFINHHNLRGDVSYGVALNQFADQDAQEIQRNFKSSIKFRSGFQNINYNGQIPEEKDWRKEGAVSPVKDLSQIGSATVVAAADTIESSHFIATKQLIDLSEQQLIDCAKLPFITVDGLYQYAEQYPLERSQDYTSKTGSCSYDPTKALVKVLKIIDVQPNSPQQMKEAVATAPVSAGISAGSPEFMFYSSGIIDSNNCSTQIDHIVMIVGYGKQQGTEYWIVKNSWGSAWGEQGYARVAIKGGAGVCGINQYVSFPITN